MYDFHCNFIKENFDAELLFTDTDSLTYEIKSKNVDEESFKWKDLCSDTGSLTYEIKSRNVY